LTNLGRLIVPYEPKEKTTMPASSPRLFLVAVCALAFITSYVARAADEKDTKAAKAGASQFDVPDGTPDELLAFIKKMQKSPTTGTRQERMDQIRNANQAIATAAERIADAKVDDDTAVAAIRAQLDALAMLKRLGDNSAGEKLDALTDKLKNDKRSAVSQMLKLLTLQRNLEKLDANDADAVERFLADVKGTLSDAEPEPQMFPLAQAATMLLYRNGKQDEAAELGRKLAERFCKSDNPDMAMPAAQLASLTGQILEAQGNEKQAAMFYKDFADRFSKSDNPILRQAASQFESSASKLELVGQPMPISGKLVEGGQFDIAQFKGKVVLVDFWATWCGPCIAELPNVKDTYSKFHDRGFEVVGISLDNDVDALTKFIMDEHIPWPILFEGGKETSGWNHPLAKQYHVNGIPMAVLVDRDGKVVTLSARGEKLGELVEGLLGSKGAAGADGGSKKEKKAG
jgi:peroxiredoxin